MIYSRFISLNDAIYFNLFDEIPFCQIKQFFQPWVDSDKCDFDVVIEDLHCNKPGYKRVRFEYSLWLMNGNENSFESFTKELEFHISSGIAQRLLSLENNQIYDACLCGNICFTDDLCTHGIACGICCVCQKCYDEMEDEMKDEMEDEMEDEEN